MQYLTFVVLFFLLFLSVRNEYIPYLLVYLCDNKKNKLSFFVFAVKYRKTIRIKACRKEKYRI